MFPLDKILVATDFSDASDAAIDTAIALASRVGATITLVHAYELPFYGFPEAGMIAQAEVAADLDTSLHQVMRDEIASREDSGVAMTHVVRMGPAVEAINMIADEIAADLIVVGTHGRTGLVHAILGSTAEHVVRSAVRPVLIVRKPAAALSDEDQSRKNAPHEAHA